MIKKIYIGSDHAGYDLKEKLKTYIQSLNIEVVDKGAFSLDINDDYPDFIIPVAEAVVGDVGDSESLGIILGGSGEGEQISANKVDGIRAIEYYGGDLEIVKLGREHNNANILSLGARFINEQEAEEAVRLFIETPFSNEERHVRRINKIEINKINRNFKILYYISAFILVIIGFIFFSLKTTPLGEFPKKLNYLELWPLSIFFIFILLFLIRANRNIR